MGNRVRRKLGILLLVWLAPLSTTASTDCKPWAARIVSVQGEIEVKQASTSNWHTVNRNDTFCPGDSIRVGNNSRAAIVLANETLLRLDQNSAIKLTQFETELPSILEFIKGIGHFISRVPRSLKIETATVDAAIEGTEFVVAVKADKTTITVFEGLVRAENRDGEVTLTNGESVSAKAGVAPTKVLVAAPRDAVQWGLYFPPIIDPYRITVPTDELAVGAIREAQSRLAANDIAGAIASLDKVPDALRDAGFYNYRASLLLFAGRVDDARRDLDRALTQDPANGNAMALKAVIAIVFNDRDEARRLADTALQATPKSSAVHIAQSYVHQAFFDLPAALASAQQAAELDTNNALAWARVSELQLAQGYMRRALEAAETGAELNPDLAIIQTTLGFAYLAQIRIKPAIEVFEMAITQNQVNPLPRLGLGLAKIRGGKLQEGRRDIEIAASLDPNNSIVRSYLGKAYFEEKRAPLDAEQYAIAKELDRNDPTPWFYDAIRLQTENRPVEALQNIQKSIELNDNRAVYRSSLKLDQDAAVRSTNQARIYQDLGFEQLALVEGYKSVNTDPSDFSSHRFLADVYSVLPRHEIAQVSELLQSQLLQPLNRTPIQPQFTQSNLKILEEAGPRTTGFNEFNPMFTRNSIGVQVDGLAGSNHTRAGDLILSGIWDWFSFSIGQSHFETEGFRENNDQKHKVSHAFTQFSLRPTSNLQFEWRSLDTERGDIEMRFDPQNFRPDRRQVVDEEVARVGFREALTPDSNLLLSVIKQDRKETDFDTASVVDEGPPPVQVDAEILLPASSDSIAGELQYLVHKAFHNTIAGIGTFTEDVTAPATITRTLTFIGLPIPPTVVPSSETIELETKYHNLYAYSTIKPNKNVAVTLGLSYDDLTDRLVNITNSTTNELARQKLNPKLGVTWDLAASTTLRLAGFRTLNRPFVGRQTLEPTQVAGFNQFFDDLNGTVSERYGIGIDHRFGKELFGGIEFSRRDLSVPLLVSNRESSQEEQLHRAYINWAPNKKLGFSAEGIFDSFKQEEFEFEAPKELETYFFPLRVSVFTLGGLFANVTATWVRQDVEYFQAEGKSRFWTVDANINYRLPKRLGFISLGVTNLFDELFNYEDRNFQISEPQLTGFIPERQVFVRLMLSLD